MSLALIGVAVGLYCLYIHLGNKYIQRDVLQRWADKKNPRGTPYLLFIMFLGWLPHLLFWSVVEIFNKGD